MNSSSRRALAGGIAMASLCLAAPAHAGVAHTVAPGETLWSIAAANNLTTRSVAAANGLSAAASVVLGSTITVPSDAEGAAALGGSAPAPTPVSAGGPRPSGTYTVQPGDTLSGIAARAGVGAGAVAAMNGLAPDAEVIAGSAMKLPAGSPASVATTAPARPVASGSGPEATPGRVGASEIGQIAGQHGVSGSLAAAIAWQESGFNNGMVSSANARGVMQVMPGTWSWVEENLAGRKLDPSSAQDNVSAGSLYLGELLRESGGDTPTAIASYYQGQASVRRVGMLPETQRYVANVMALRSRFSG